MNWDWTSIDNMASVLLSKTPTQLQIEFSQLQDPCQLSSPFLSATFLHALETSNSVGGTSGWLPKHLLIRDSNHKLIAFLPAYIKTHSYGEYVFDHSWADAYQQHGLRYYPKLIIAVPFTPVTGPRILLSAEVTIAQISEYLAKVNKEMLERLSVSSVHFLFANQALSDALQQQGFHQRQSVQFNWHNNDYASFDDFMAQLTARRRRSIRKERTSISKQGVQIKRVSGTAISKQDMAFFYTCYQQTYLKRSGHTGYLSQSFFENLLRHMPENLLLVVAQSKANEPSIPEFIHLKANNSQTSVAENDNKPQSIRPIAAALFLYDKNGLYGRYWGALKDVSGLHFEACYYQGIEFCIEQNIPLFNPGTQGEHKILRGFVPTICYSNHKMREAAFDRAVQDFLQRETPHIIDYAKQSSSLLPFKSLQDSKDTAS
jgi:hypothetical protein